ncbi:TPR-like protein [Pluteus cervinus]|uniref:TPR-like protein n=1 Tax=Pluteus cervinus TaxID=181527 RepID=A0ACD3AU02_9AGAR|nr:TPR-like protein [Pluteus cervinus]
MNLDITRVEKSLLTGRWSSQEPAGDHPISQLAEDVIHGSFRHVLTSPEARSMLMARFTTLEQPLAEALTSSVPKQGDTPDRELLRLVLAVACLHAFVQVNWTGPDLNVQPLEVISADSDASLTITEESLNSKAVAELAYGGEPAYHLARGSAFLRIAQILLELPYTHCPSIAWWRLRATFVHQQILDEPAPFPSALFDSLNDLPSVLISDPELAGRLSLEQGLVEHQISQDKSAADYFIRAAKATGLQYELTGALGKRTKFQETELSQLVLLAESHLQIGGDENGGRPGADSTMNTTSADGGSSSPNTSDPAERTKLPETLALNDDTLLEQTEFTSSKPGDDRPSGSLLAHIDPSRQPPLHPLDQCILLSLCLNVRNTSPAHGLTTEQMTPYVVRVITHPCNWSVHTMALLLRSRLESSRTRTVERSTLQLQALIDQMPTADSDLSERLLYFHSIPLPSKWEMERELARRFMSLGVIKSALEIFERLEMWEDVIKCYGMLEKPEEGRAIVRDLLEGTKAEAETVIARSKASFAGRQRQTLDSAREAKLWCLLGDLEPQNSVEHYTRAWSISQETSGRAMRSLGGYHFARENFVEAIICLKRAVAINPLLSRSWFILGCASMRVEDWEGAKNAFSRCVAIDEEDGESWSNLATMYLRLGTQDPEKVKDDNKTQLKGDSMTYGDDSRSIPFENKLRAFRALQQGLKYSYDNWRMWYNYMVVAMDVGELFEASRALTRVVEETSAKTGAQSVDEDVLERLVDAATRESPSGEGEVTGGGDNSNSTQAAVNPNDGLLRNVVILLEKTILPRVSSPRIFRAYAKLLTFQGKLEEALKAHLESYRASVAGVLENGESDVEKWREAVGEVEEIVDVLKNFGPRVEGFKWRLQARSIVRAFVGRSRDFEDEPEWSKLTTLQDDLRKAEED